MPTCAWRNSLLLCVRWLLVELLDWMDCLQTLISTSRNVSELTCGRCCSRVLRHACYRHPDGMQYFNFYPKKKVFLRTGHQCHVCAQTIKFFQKCLKNLLELIIHRVILCTRQIHHGLFFFFVMRDLFDICKLYNTNVGIISLNVEKELIGLTMFFLLHFKSFWF